MARVNFSICPANADGIFEQYVMVNEPAGPLPIASCGGFCRVLWIVVEWRLQLFRQAASNSPRGSNRYRRSEFPRCEHQSRGGVCVCAMGAQVQHPKRKSREATSNTIGKLSGGRPIWSKMFCATSGAARARRHRRRRDTVSQMISRRSTCSFYLPSHCTLPGAGNFDCEKLKKAIGEIAQAKIHEKKKKKTAEFGPIRYC